MRRGKIHFSFRAYAGREHNFFGVKDGRADYSNFYWNKAGDEFRRWAGLRPAAGSAPK